MSHSRRLHIFPHLYCYYVWPFNDDVIYKEKTCVPYHVNIIKYYDIFNKFAHHLQNYEGTSLSKIICQI